MIIFINGLGLLAQCKFLVTERGLSILGLQVLKQIQIMLYLSAAPIKTTVISESQVMCS